MDKFILLISSMFVCIAAGWAYAGTQNDDAWVQRVPESLSQFEWVELDNAYINEVAPEYEGESQKFLMDFSVKHLEYAQAVKLAGKKLTRYDGREYYLVRGVYYNLSTGDFYVFSYKDMLYVHHVSLGDAEVSMKRKTLLLSLQERPKQVFVDCSMAR